MFSLVIAAALGLFLFNETRTLLFRKDALALSAIPMAATLVGVALEVFGVFAFHFAAGPLVINVVPYAACIGAYVLARGRVGKYAERRAEAVEPKPKSVSERSVAS